MNGKIGVRHNPAAMKRRVRAGRVNIGRTNRQGGVPGWVPSRDREKPATIEKQMGKMGETGQKKPGNGRIEAGGFGDHAYRVIEEKGNGDAVERDERKPVAVVKPADILRKPVKEVGIPEIDATRTGPRGVNIRVGGNEYSMGF